MLVILKKLVWFNNSELGNFTVLRYMFIRLWFFLFSLLLMAGLVFLYGEIRDSSFGTDKYGDFGVYIVGGIFLITGFWTVGVCSLGLSKSWKPSKIVEVLLLPFKD